MKQVILHHSLTTDGEVKDFDAIKKYHMHINGWDDIGYHYVIEKVNDSYVTFKGRPEYISGAHTKNHNNAIGICCVGNFDKDELPFEMRLELDKLLYDLHKRYDGIVLSGHRDWSEKTCPGKKFPLDEFKAIWNQPHWAEQSYQYLLQNWVNTLDRRFDDTITRGETFSLLERILRKMEE